MLWVGVLFMISSRLSVAIVHQDSGVRLPLDLLSLYSGSVGWRLVSRLAAFREAAERLKAGDRWTG